MRIPLHEFFENLGYPVSWKKALDIYEETGIYYYALSGSDSYGYITKEKLQHESFCGSDPSKSSLTQAKWLYNYSDELQKFGVKTNKWGKLLRIYFGEDIATQEFIDNFIIKLKGSLDPSPNKDNFVILTDIVGAYRNTPINSCMSNDDSYKVQLYTKLGAKYLKQINSDGIEVSRSLLWDSVEVLDEDENPIEDKVIKLCDRIYSKNTEAYTQHVLYAASLGYHVRICQNYDDKTLITSSDNPLDKSNADKLSLRISLHSLGLTESDIDDIPWPYMDTFTFYSKSREAFYNENYRFCCFEASNTDGSSYYKPGKYECPHCHRDFDPEDGYSLGYELYCSDCVSICDDCNEPYLEHDGTRVHGNRHVTWVCPCCIENGDYARARDDNYRYYHIDDLTYCEDISEYVREDYKYCESDDNYYYNWEDLIEIDDKYYLDDDDSNIIQIGDTWYLKEDSNLVEIDGLYFLKDDENLILIHGLYYLKNDTSLVLIEGEYYLREDPDRPRTLEELGINQLALEGVS